jgi:predicted small secreted protein
MKFMKKIVTVAFAAISLAACNDNTADNATVDTNKDTIANTNTTTTTTTSTNESAAYAPAEGDVTYRGNKVMVMRNGQWVESNEDVRLDNGVVVYRDGRVKRDNNEIRLEDGEVVNRTGNFFDRAGNTLEKGWDKTKEGVKDAGKAIGNTAEKIGEKAKKAVKDDDKDNQ